MTYADQDFMPVEGEEEAPSYPTVFGITFTPTVSGVVIAVLGLGAAAYLAMQVVKPVWDKNQELTTQRDDKKSQLVNLAEIQKQIQQQKAKLEAEKQQNKQVIALFANEKKLDTILIDINSFVKDRKGTLTSFKPQEKGKTDEKGADGVVTDGSLGPLVNNKLKRQSFNVELEGSFDQVQSILRSFERLQSLLIVKDFKTEVADDQGLLINPESGKSTPAIFKKEGQKIVPGGKPTIKTTFKLQALSPLTEDEAKKVAAPAATPPAQN